MNSTVKAIIVISCLLAATWWSYTLHGSPKIGIDDANIFFSYAENFAAGNGITYAHNADRVEGFTSMLWLLLCAFVFYLGYDESAVLACSLWEFTTDCWTRKEAFIKAVGDGLCRPLDSFDVTLGRGEPVRLLRMEEDSNAAFRWSIQHLKPAPNYIGAFAAETHMYETKCLRWEVT